MDRRSFVKGCVAAAGSAAALGGAWGVARSLAKPRPRGTEVVRYFGAQRHPLAPAPRGLPLIPLRSTEKGVVEGRPAVPDGAGGDLAILKWYRYCQHQGAPGLREAYAGTNDLRYLLPDRSDVRPWYAERAGETVRADDFPEEGFAAHFAWRSDGAQGGEAVTGIVIRVARDRLKFPSGPALVSPASALSPGEREVVLREFVTPEGLLAVSSYCTHFCCQPGWWTEAPDAAIAHHGRERIYCSCHHSVFNPGEIVAFEFVPEPVPADDALT